MEYKTKYLRNDERTSIEVDQEYFADQNITWEVVRDSETFRSISGEWNNLVGRSDAQVFQTHEWQYTWWKYFAEHNSAHHLHILLFFNEDQLVGIAPFFIDVFKCMGRKIYRSLRLIGSKVIQSKKGKLLSGRTYSGFLDLIILPGYESQVCSKLRDYLKKSNKEYDNIIFEEIPEYSVLVSHFLPALRDHEEIWKLSVEDSSVSMTTKLPSDWNDFLSELSRNARKKVKRYFKRVSDDANKKIFDSYTISEQPEFNQAFEWLVEYHQKRWNKRGKPGIFADQRVYVFYKKISRLFQKKGIAKLQAVTIPEKDDRYIVVDLFLQYRQTIYSLQTSFDDSSPYAKYSPGHISLFSIIKDAIGNGMKYLNLERGEESYKLRMTNLLIQNKNISIQYSAKSKIPRLILYRFLYWMFWNKYKLNYEWEILMIFCREYHFFPGLNKYRNDLLGRLSNRISD